ncbi:MAG: CHAT domain-containing protein [Caldilineaceae bacterium]
MKTAVATLEARGLLRLTRLPLENQHGATLAELQRQLRRTQFHIFHYIGHGAFDEQTQDGVLLLEADDGRSRVVSGNYLGTLLHDHPTLRLAVLNACEGARTTSSDPFAGVAQQLVRQGIPAVIAMQFAVTDSAAQQLSQEFYSALVEGYPVEGALVEARKAIYTAGNDIEWGTPVLYLRAADGRLFDLKTQPSGAATVSALGTAGQSSTATEAAPTVGAGQSLHRRWQLRWGLALLAGLLILIAGRSLWRWQQDNETSPPATSSTPGVPANTVASATPIPPTPTIFSNESVSRTIMLGEASSALNLGDAAAAKPIYDQLLRANPADADALVGLASALRLDGDDAAALRNLAQAAAIAPDEPKVT